MLRIDAKHCVLCEDCVGACPFGALSVKDAVLRVNDCCNACGLCAQSCAYDALSLEAAEQADDDLCAWSGILVVADLTNGALSPVSLELAGAAIELAKPYGISVSAVAIGQDIGEAARTLARCDLHAVYAYDDPAFAHYREDVYANTLEQCIRQMRPAVVLVGGTDVGKSLAPVVSARFRSGLTADCTELEMREDGALVQIRPAFGGNIMARIVTEHRRPQFATVRQGILNPAVQAEEPKAPILARVLAQEALRSRIEILRADALPKKADIASESVLIAVGAGFASREDLWMAEELARLLGGSTASSRALVEKGWMPPEKQIGLSGSTVRPDLIITLGVSGSIQFMTGMKHAKHIVAVNSDPNAPIFSIAHVPLCGDLYEIVPRLLKKLSEV